MVATVGRCYLTHRRGSAQAPLSKGSCQRQLTEGLLVRDN